MYDFNPVYYNWFGNDTSDMELYQTINDTEKMNGTMLNNTFNIS